MMALFIFNACEDEKSIILPPADPKIVTQEPASDGDADFTKYIAIGNSLTAGFMDAALYDRGQMNSFPKILSTQFKAVGGGDFNQPDINSENGFSGLSGRMPLGRLKLNERSLPAPITPGEIPTSYTGNKNTLNNFSVPGILVAESLLPTLRLGPTGRLYYARFASNLLTSSLISDAADAMRRGGTFFTFWLGGNDILGYAIDGADDMGGDPYTPVADFRVKYKEALDSILKAAPSAKGLIANIPSVTAAPFFTTIKYNDFVLTRTDAVQADNTYRAQFRQTVAPGIVTLGVVATELASILPRLVAAGTIAASDVVASSRVYLGAFTAALLVNPMAPVPRSSRCGTTTHFLIRLRLVSLHY